MGKDIGNGDIVALALAAVLAAYGDALTLTRDDFALSAPAGS